MKQSFIILFLFVLLFVGKAYGQAILLGKVLVDKEPVPGATISFEGLRIGSITDVNGKYEIVGVPTGRWVVKFSYVGYKSVSKNVDIIANEMNFLTVELNTKDSLQLEEVIITDKRRDASDTKTSVIDISPERAKVMAGGAEDVLRTLQSLPGVLAPSDFSSQLVVRGSGPDQNLIVIDNIEIFNPYRLYGLISMFNPDAVEDITLLTGGFPAQYGDRLSAVLDVTNRSGLLNKSLKGSINTSITNANLVLEGKNPFGIGGSWMINTRRTYYDLIIEPFVKKAGLVDDNVAFPNFYDLQGKILIKPWEKQWFTISGIYSADGVNLVSGKNRKTPDSISVNNTTRNNVIGASWYYAINKNMLNRVTVSYYENSGVTGFDSDVLDPTLNRKNFEGTISDTLSPYLLNFKFDSDFIFTKSAIEEKFLATFDKTTLEAGLGYDYIANTINFTFKLDPQLQAIFANNPNIKSAFKNLADVSNTKRYKGYVQSTFNFYDKFYATLGLRGDYYTIIDKSYLAPRLSFSYAIDAVNTMRFAYGVYYQSPGYEKLRDQNVLYDLNEAYTKNVNAEKAIHYVLGYERWLSSEWNVKIEGYYKDFSDLLVAKKVKGTSYYSAPVAGQDPRTIAGWTQPVAIASDSITQIPINNSYGEAYGLEVLLAKKNLEQGSRVSGWVSYSFAYANRYEDGVKTPFQFDQRHTVNIVLDFKLSDIWNLGVRWEYGSGFPITEPIGIKPRVILVDANGDGKPETPKIATRVSINNPNSTTVIYDINYADKSKYNSRKPAYHRLDVRISASAEFWGSDWNFYLDIINIYNHSNVLNYQYYIDENLTLSKEPTNMFPILPTFGVSVRF